MTKTVNKVPGIYKNEEDEEHVPDRDVVDPRKDPTEDAPAHVPSDAEEEANNPPEMYFPFPIPLGQELYQEYAAEKDWLINRLAHVAERMRQLEQIKPAMVQEASDG